ncbi:MAG: hypothetical protein A3B89_04565 [Candidatus Buchananbacteria bacterium RIFCSPHIGHO2_02_FULL_40_13]|uniref:AB hydrolase-1 domain-containing protein n=1 Tax=Candidatus Buchananbacteria bacterium RIFCSPLOWO2_01_FULL_39_33 TaxID=1797543 RepID=A0A1G1YJG3_9BACT|nr:MAG: hypothetical protein A3B89_04565 [Candidatus Buchananbacteria bacterium RIFCSPHIGHO2_02_FULL_40_13]OGY52439.1 MAG: hypothetical protein A3A02_00740 [Candidatus Buchananbacteria bacterium RIFCSPLOWO2_01_FULL_39_33]
MKFSPESLRNIEKPEEHLVPEENIIDINPTEKKFETPVIVAPGWGKIVEPFKENSLKVIAEEGRRILSLDHLRKIEIKNIPEGVPAEEIQKALAILDVLDQKEIDRADAVGHSEGGLYLALAASIKPEKFRNLVFVDPAGMIGQDSFFDLAYRFAIKEGRQSKLPPLMMLKAMMEYVGQNPAMSFKEVKQMSQADIYEVLKYLKKQGLGLAFVFGVDDVVFPMDRVQKTYSQKREAEEIGSFKDILDGFYSISGTHGEFIGHGEMLEPQVLPKAVGKILSALEKKSSKTSQ